MEKHKSCLLVRLNRNLLFIRDRSLGTFTYSDATYFTSLMRAQDTLCDGTGLKQYKRKQYCKSHDAP